MMPRLLSILLFLSFIGISIGKSQCPKTSCAKKGICASRQKAISPAPTLSVLSHKSDEPSATLTVTADCLPTAGFDSDDFFATKSLTKKKRALEDPVSNKEAYVDALYGRMSNEQFVPLDEEDFTTTARYWNWNTAPGQTAAGIEGLCGCTSVLVLSDVGAYISHIWDDSFEEGDCSAEEAVNNVMGTLWNGNSLDNSPGLRGLTQPGQPLSLQNSPAVFILGGKEDDESELTFENEISILRQHLIQAVPSSENPKIVPYIIDLESTMSLDNHNGRAAAEHDSRQSSVVFNGSPTPSSMWRLWVQHKEIARHQFVHPSNAN